MNVGLGNENAALLGRGGDTTMSVTIPAASSRPFCGEVKFLGDARGFFSVQRKDPRDEPGDSSFLVDVDWGCTLRDAVFVERFDLEIVFRVLTHRAIVVFARRIHHHARIELIRCNAHANDVPRGIP